MWCKVRFPFCSTRRSSCISSPLRFGLLARGGISSAVSRTARAHAAVTAFSDGLTFSCSFSLSQRVGNPTISGQFIRCSLPREAWPSNSGPRVARGSLRPIYVTALILGGALVAPIALPVLSPEGFIRYIQVSHLPIPEVEHQLTGPLHQQIYADMFGWEEMARETARAYNNLPPEIRAKTAIAASSFGEAGAIDLFGPKYGLPKRSAVIRLIGSGDRANTLAKAFSFFATISRRAHELCENVDVVGHVEHPYSRGDEHFDIYWCHPMRASLQEIWPTRQAFQLSGSTALARNRGQ